MFSSRDPYHCYSLQCKVQAMYAIGILIASFKAVDCQQEFGMYTSFLPFHGLRQPCTPCWECFRS